MAIDGNQIFVHNTLTGNKERFESRESNRINFFACGPTVYDYPHLGHAKTYTQFDVIVRYLRLKGYDVHYPTEHHRYRRQDYSARSRARL